jgi:hypothetical protein
VNAPFLRRLRLPPRPLVGLLATRAGLFVTLAYLSYLLVVNLALALGHAVGLPEDVKVRFASAWSWYPGQVQARDVRIIGTDSHVQWQLDIEHVRFRLSVTALFRRRFHASAVRGTGVTMRIRQKLDAAKATPEALAVLPPIEGVRDPPVRPAVPLPPIADADYNLWSAQLDDVDAEGVREVWFDAYRFTGEAHVTGSFALRPLRMARIGPAAISVTRGELRIGKETALEGLAGHVNATVGHFDPRQIDDVTFLRYVTAALRGHGRVASLRFLNHYLPEASEPKVDGGGGPVEVDVHVVSGVLVAPGTVSLDLERVDVTSADDRASAAAHIALFVDGKPKRPEASVSMELAGLELRRAGVQAPILRAPRLALFGRSTDLDLVRPFGDATASGEISSADLPDLRWLNPYLGNNALSLLAGRAHVHATFSASVPTHGAKGNLALVTDGLVVRVADSDVRGTANVGIVLGDLDLSSLRGDLSGSRIEVRDLVLSNAPKEAAWWIRVELQKAHLALAPPTRLHAQFTLEAKDGRPLLRQLMPVWLANLIGLDGLHGGGTVTVASSLVDVEKVEVEGGGYDVRGEFGQRGQRSHGVALMRSGQSAVGLELSDGATSLRLFGAEDWYGKAVGASAPHGG